MPADNFNANAQAPAPAKPELKIDIISYDRSSNLLATLAEEDFSALQNLTDFAPGSEDRIFELTDLSPTPNKKFFCAFTVNEDDSALQKLVATATLTTLGGSHFMSEISTRKGYEKNGLAYKLMHELMQYASENNLVLTANLQPSPQRNTVAKYYQILHKQFPNLQILYSGENEPVYGSTPYSITEMDNVGGVKIQRGSAPRENLTHG